MGARWIGGLLLLAACGEGSRAPRAAGAAAGAPLPEPVAADTGRPVVLFLGTSLTAGLGVSPEEAYPALIQQKIDSAGLPFAVVNAGVSGETTAGGLRRLDWLLQHPIAVLVLELGANDALRGQDLEATRANLQAIIDRTRAAHPAAQIVIAGMQAPPNLGERYTRRFRALFGELARQNRAALIPFLLEGVAAVPRLNQADGIHPTAEGHRIVAATVWRVLAPVLQRAAGRRPAAGRPPAGRPAGAGLRRPASARPPDHLS